MQVYASSSDFQLVLGFVLPTVFCNQIHQRDPKKKMDLKNNRKYNNYNIIL